MARVLQKPTLKVKAIDEHDVTNYQAMKDRVRRVVGKRHVETDVILEDGRSVIKHSFECTGEVVEVPDTKEYRAEVKLGTLEPADEATCVTCGLLKVVYHFV